MRTKEFTSFIFLFLFFATHAKEDALIFDPEDGSIFLLPNDDSEYMTIGDRALACPAETPEEDDFVRENSFTKNAMFVKETHFTNTEISQIKINFCKNPYTISLAYKIKNSTFQFGYEHYTSDYEDYTSPEIAINSTKTRHSRGNYHADRYFPILFQTIKRAIGVGVKTFPLNGEEMGLMWLYLFKLRFNLSKKILEVTWHEIQANNKWSTDDKCRDYSLGSEAYEGTNVDTLYNNQAEIYKNIKLPSDPCLVIEQCLMKWSLIPLDQFRFGSSTPPLCSNMSTIPIWRGKVEKLLQKLDQYLYTLFRILNEPIHIHSGITGEHKFSSEGAWMKSTLYLDSKNNEIPIPRLIYKVVEYRLKDCKLKESSCWYSAIIVIHNDPFLKPSDKICIQDVTQEWGWEEITKDPKGNRLDEIYVCRNEKRVEKQLQMDVREKVAGGLNLTKFVYSNDGERLEEKNIKEIVDIKFEKLSKEGEVFDPLSTKIVRRVLPQSNTSDDAEVDSEMS